MSHKVIKMCMNNKSVSSLDLCLDSIDIHFSSKTKNQTKSDKQQTRKRYITIDIQSKPTHKNGKYIAFKDDAQSSGSETESIYDGQDYGKLLLDHYKSKGKNDADPHDEIQCIFDIFGDSNFMDPEPSQSASVTYTATPHYFQYFNVKESTKNNGHGSMSQTVENVNALEFVKRKTHSTFSTMSHSPSPATSKWTLLQSYTKTMPTYDSFARPHDHKESPISSK